ncbi:MAG: hypothetical protein ACM3UR_14620 [Bacteroidota bacterium]|jgi:hypothetical protein|nr:hypothetical protein [Ignavibacteria bacterium]MCU7499030.1 hypothetical protein [Ignavibacteria bacterium]MCU7512398.1 hypothetical protein [Ignavibacteria bacterium]MCU7521749.1 hypothetical protein [Ignavibacteria bacterium]MCU7524402.1 hypothetical protein [Ignavibacteria bacterium]
MKKLLRFAPFLLLALFITACNEKITDILSPNEAPHTFMSLMPDGDISKQPSKLKVSWWGDDPDGLVVGYYFSWDDVHWSYTTKNDSVFALKIGASDVSYNFKVAAVDNGGNGVYDNSVVQNGIDFGPEPFVDQNGDGKYTPGEKFYDIGLIDPKPASLKYPLKNSAPQLEFNQLTTLPEVSYPVMTLGWDASDVDGVETIVKINIALNDTTKFVTLPGNTRLVMLRMKDFNTSGAQTEILINASEGNIYSQKLDGFKLNDYNKVYIQAEDISGAKSAFTALPSESRKWYVKKPAGSVLIIDDNKSDPAAADFFKNVFNTMHGGALANKYEVWDISANKVPYENVTFLETIKFFKYIFWYSDDAPNLNEASISSRKFIDLGGKIAFSMPLPEKIDKSVSAAENSLLLNNLLKSFLPVDSVGSTYKKDYLTTLFSSNGKVTGINSLYPDLKIITSIYSVRSIYPKESYSVPIYNLETTQLSGNKIIGVRDLEKKLFFIALPLAKADGNQGNVKLLLEKIFFEDFGLSL